MNHKFWGYPAGIFRRHSNILNIPHRQLFWSNAFCYQRQVVHNETEKGSRIKWQIMIYNLPPMTFSVVVAAADCPTLFQARHEYVPASDVCTDVIVREGLPVVLPEYRASPVLITVVCPFDDVRVHWTLVAAGVDDTLQTSVTEFPTLTEYWLCCTLVTGTSRTSR